MAFRASKCGSVDSAFLYGNVIIYVCVCVTVRDMTVVTSSGTYVSEKQYLCLFGWRPDFVCIYVFWGRSHAL